MLFTPAIQIKGKNYNFELRITSRNHQHAPETRETALGFSE